MYNYCDGTVHFKRRKCSTSPAVGVQLERYIQFVESQGTLVESAFYCRSAYRGRLWYGILYNAAIEYSTALAFAYLNNMHYLILSQGWVYEGYIPEIIAVLKETDGWLDDFYVVSKKYEYVIVHTDDGECMYSLTK